MFYTKVKRIIFNNGQSLDVNTNDIIIFVGPNNSGKSQSLKDIYSKIGENGKSIVVNDVDIEKGDKSELKNFILNNSKIIDDGGTCHYEGYNYNIYNYNFNSYNSSRLDNNLRKYVVSLLNTEDRLKLSDPPSAIDITDSKKHPIHYVRFNSEYQKQISSYFKEAFGSELTPNYVSTKEVPLCIGPVPYLESGYVPDLNKKMTEIFSSYPKLHEQGDGMRSFVGIILHLIIQNYGLFLIDEPESFLHPPQAKILGKVIGEMLGQDRQAFIATHSEDIIKGLLELCPERIKVIRLTRDGNTNHFSILNNSQFNSIWNDPLLRYSNIMSSLFHNNVVICESDSDCRFYSIILDYLKKQEGRYSETLFIHCSGKQRMKQVATALKSLSIDFRCIPDIDILNDKQICKSLFEACGGLWDETLDSNYNSFARILNGGRTTIAKSNLLDQINIYLTNFSSEDLTNKDLEKLKNQIKIESKWSELKKSGISFIPSGPATVSFNILHSAMKGINIYPVPVGELERFVREEDGHGPTWVNTVLEKHPDLEDAVYSDVKAFIKSWHL